MVGLKVSADPYADINNRVESRGFPYGKPHLIGGLDGEVDTITPFKRLFILDAG